MCEVTEVAVEVWEACVVSETDGETVEVVCGTKENLGGRAEA